MNPTLSSNLKLLAKRFPSLAEKLFNAPIGDVITTTAKDGGLCYVKKRNDGRWHALSNNIDPILKAQQSVTSLESRIGKGLAPAVIIGLNPGYTLDILFKHFKDNYYDKYIPRRIYVIVDSLDCLYGWLQDKDRSAILEQTEIEFYWHQEVKRIVRQCKKDEQRSHLFIPISTLPEAVSMKLIEPLAEFFISRQEEEKALYLENCKYYEKQSDDELDKIIAGKAGRKPRLLIPSHASSTVVQYSVRDTKAMFEKEGWEVRVMHMKTDLSRWRINKNINDFKPDIYLQVNHLRTEDTDFYPPEMMYITWVQDTVSYINNSENAKSWNEHVKSKKKRRDLIIGYVGQVKQYGYQEDRLSECPMIVNQDIFKERELTPEEKAKYECDICFASNRSKETHLIVKEDLAPKLEKYGFTDNILMSIHDHLWEYYRDEKTCVGYIQLEDKIIELPKTCELIEKLINKDDHDFVIQRIYWELNDVIYRHIVLEWIDEMGDKKLHLYGRGWEDHPRFSKYAKGILEHGEELALAYQCAKQCLHLNSLEGDHQRLQEIIDAKGIPITRLSIDKENLDRQKQILEGFKDFNKPNIHFINNLWNTSKRILDTFPKRQFKNQINALLKRQFKNLSIKFNYSPCSFYDKSSFESHKIRFNSVLNNSKCGLFTKILNTVIKEDKNNTNTILPIDISEAIASLILENKPTELKNNHLILSNIVLLTIIHTRKSEQENVYCELVDKINFDDLILEFIKPYLKLRIQNNNLDKLEELIEYTYSKYDNIYDLYFLLTKELFKQDIDRLDISLRDLELGKLSLHATCNLTTLAEESLNYKKLLKSIYSRRESIVQFNEITLFELSSFIHLTSKVLCESKSKRLVSFLENYCEPSLVQDSLIISNCETYKPKYPNDKTYTKISRLVQIYYSEDNTTSPQILQTALTYRLINTAGVILKFLLKNKYTIPKMLVLNYLDKSKRYNRSISTELINLLYSVYCDDLSNLYSHYGSTNSVKSKTENLLKDLKLGRASLRNIHRILSQCSKTKDKNKIYKALLINWRNITNIHSLETWELKYLFTEMIQSKHLEDPTLKSKNSQFCNTSAELLLAYKAAFAEYCIDHDTTCLDIYQNSIDIHENDIGNKRNLKLLVNYIKIILNKSDKTPLTEITFNDFDNFVKLANSAFRKAYYSPLLIMYEEFKHQYTFPVPAYLKISKVLRNHNYDDAIKVFSYIPKDLWNNNCEIHSQFTNFIFHKKYTLANIKPPDSIPEKLLLTVLEIESGIQADNLQRLSDQVNQTGHLIWICLIYLRINRKSQAMKILKIISEDLYITVKNGKVSILDISKLFPSIDKTSSKFIVFRLNNPLKSWTQI